MSMTEMKGRIESAGEQAWIQGNLAALDEVYAADYVWRRPPFPDVIGIEAVKESVTSMREAYSDPRYSYDEMIADGNSIAYRYSLHGRHTGQSTTLPILPTGAEVSLVGSVVVPVRDGKIVEEFEYSDYLGFLQQLEAVESVAVLQNSARNPESGAPGSEAERSANCGGRAPSIPYPWGFKCG